MTGLRLFFFYCDHSLFSILQVMKKCKIMRREDQNPKLTTRLQKKCNEEMVKKKKN